MNGRLIVWLLVIFAAGAVALPSTRIKDVAREEPSSSDSRDGSATSTVTATGTTGSSDDDKRLAVREEEAPRKMRYWYEPVKGLKLDVESNELIVKYNPFKNAAESRDGGLFGGSGEAAGGIAETGGKGKKGKKGKKEKGKKKDKPTMMQRIGTFMMMIPVTMQLMQLPMAIATVKMSLLRSILVGKLALLLLLLRSLLTQQPQEKIVVVRAPPKEVHEHFYHPFEDPEDNKPGWLELATQFLGGGNKDHSNSRDYGGSKNNFANGEVYDHINECESKPDVELLMKPTEAPVYKKPSAQEAVEALDTYTKWFESEMDVDTKDKKNFEVYRNKAVDKL